jgi:tetratricopeptide (TPR) repeat protein
MNTPDLKQLFGAGAQLFQQRRFEEACRVFQRAAALAPGSAPAWCNLAAACIELRQPVQALAAADRAIALDPAFAPAHANRGDALRLGQQDLGLCRDAYQRAVQLQPRSPDLLNKLATTLQALGELEAAGEAYARALALAPDYRLARLNYGCLLLLQGRSARARELAQEALALPGAGASDRQEFAAAIPIIDRNLALAPALLRALGGAVPGEFIAAAAAGPDAHGHDARLAACVAGCLQRLPDNAVAHSRLDRIPDPVSDALEAHYSAHLGDDAAAARRTLEFLDTWGGSAREELPSSTTARQLDAWSYYRAIRHHRALRDRVACESHAVVAWLRYWHASLASHRPELGPGQLKAFPNSVIVDSHIERTAPALVEGTLEFIHARCAAVPPGAARAALVYYVIADVHPFADGNGRLGRFLMNRELEAARLSPVVTPASLKASLGGLLEAIRRQCDLAPFVAWLASCDSYTRGIRAGLGKG